MNWQTLSPISAKFRRDTKKSNLAREHDVVKHFARHVASRRERTHVVYTCTLMYVYSWSRGVNKRI